MISIAIRFAGVRMAQIVDTIVGLAEENGSGPNALTESGWDGWRLGLAQLVNFAAVDQETWC